MSVIAYDDDEEITLISDHKTEDLANAKYMTLENKYPNGSFDVWPTEDTKHLPKTSCNW
jgi:hypothetical protein